MGTPEVKNIAKDKNWLKDTFDQYYDGIRNYTYFKTGDVELADGIAQETFTKLWTVRQRLGHHNIKLQLYFIAGKLIKKQVKSNRVAFQFVREFVWDNETKSTTSPLINDDSYRLLQETIAQIPRLTRTVFLMHFIESLSYYEIGQRLGIKAHIVEKMIKEAKSILYSKLR